MELEKMNVYQRMAVAQAEFRYVQKEQPKGLQYAVVQHDDVAVKARAALLKARLFAQPTVVEHGREGNCTWVLVCTDYVNIDAPDDRFSVTMLGYGNDNQDKGPGKAISYACKYCHLKAFGVETGKDAESETDPVDTELPSTAEPDDAEKDAIDRDDLFARLKDTVDLNGLDKKYVWSEMHRRVKGLIPTTEELAIQVNHIAEHPDQWREPKPVEA